MTPFNQDYEEYIYDDLLQALVDKECLEEALSYFKRPSEYKTSILITNVSTYIVAIEYYAEKNKKDSREFM